MNGTNQSDQVPSVDNRRYVDSPLIPNIGVPVDQDMFADSTKQFDAASVPNNRDDVTQRETAKSVWNVDPSQFYGGTQSGLQGIDAQSGNMEKKFDLAQFNIKFERQKEIFQKQQNLKELEKLNQLQETKQIVSLYDLSILDIVVNTKTAWFEILDDILDQRFDYDVFTKENRMFYVGFTILFIACVLYLYVVLSEPTVDPEANVKKIYHIYPRSK
jgi:hypothetical protein